MKRAIHKILVCATSCLLLAFSCHANDKDTQESIEDLLLFLADEEAFEGSWYSALDFEEDITGIDKPNTNALLQVTPEEHD